jgi:hypothetical protein
LPLFIYTNSIIKNSLFDGNTAQSGAGVWATGGMTSISNSTFTSNVASSQGGGAYISGSGLLSSNRFESCEAQYGAGAYLNNGGLVSHSVFTSNDSSFAGVGAYLSNGGRIDNSLVTLNGATSFGGGIYCYFGGTVSSCTVADNTSAIGAGVYFWEGGSMNNSIVWENHSTTNTVDEIDISLEGNVDISYSCASNGVVGLIGCIDSNPEFDTSLNGGYGLQVSSPCYHTGNDADVMSDTDLAGNARTIGDHVDMGAYERESSLSLSLDADMDGISDNWEIATFGSIAACSARANADGDGSDNLLEYLAGTDALDADSDIVIKSISVNGDVAVISWDPIQNRTIEILWAGSLNNGFTSLIDDIVYPQSVYTNDLPEASTGYYKLKVINSSYGE